MSKVVKGIGRAIGKVVKGAVKLVKGVAKGVVKVFKSPIGKIALMAAGIYFGVPMISGAIGGAGTSAGIIGGAMNGLSSAWAGLTGAVGAGSMSGAMSSLSQGFSGALAPGAAAAAPAAVTGMAPGAVTSPVYSSVGAVVPRALTAPPAATGGWFSNMSPLAQAATISAGSQLAGGLIQGYGMQQQQQHQEQLAADERARYNKNIGTRLWGAAPTTVTGAPGGAFKPMPVNQSLIDEILQRARALRAGN
jgi:phage-related protein